MSLPPATVRRALASYRATGADLPFGDLLRAHDVAVVTVSDVETIAAMRLLWEELKQVVEVSSATVLAAILKCPHRFAGKRIGVVLTGGNVDLDALPW